MTHEDLDLLEVDVARTRTRPAAVRMSIKSLMRFKMVCRHRDSEPFGARCPLRLQPIRGRLEAV